MTRSPGAPGHAAGPGVGPPGAGEPSIRVLVIRPAVDSGMDTRRLWRDNPAMDPVVIALAQLVRDRYERERAEKAARRGRLRVVEGRSG